MSEENQIITIIIVIKKHSEGIWVMTSDDLPEFYLAGKNLETLIRDTPKAIKFLLEKDYKFTVSTIVKPMKPTYIKNPDMAPLFESPETWVAAGCYNLIPA